MSHPLLTQVTSSAVAAYGHLFNAAMGVVELVVEFKSGRMYHYAITEKERDELEAASSKGTYINQLKSAHTGTEVNSNDVNSILKQVSAAKSKPKSRKRKMNWSQAIKLVPERAYFF